MKSVIIFGAGKSAISCIEYLAEKAKAHNWNFTVADASIQNAKQKTARYPNVIVQQVDVTNATEVETLVAANDLVISMMPPFLHILIAKTCLHLGRHLLTASYVDDEIRSLAKSIEEKNLLFLYEMGLDPGIDHMSAMQMLDAIRRDGGSVHSFKSHCGGLVAPESSDNPWHYKITWNPKNVVLAGKAGATFLQNGNEAFCPYAQLFDPGQTVKSNAEEIDGLCWYANRNSLPYLEIYKLNESHDFVRTTLRYRDFIVGWQHIVSLHLTDETHMVEPAGQTIAAFFEQHLQMFNCGEAYQKLPQAVQQQFEYLGFSSDTVLEFTKPFSAADVLQYCMEKRLALQPNDKDMVVMQHEVEYEKEGQQFLAISSLVQTGDDAEHTAMAKTVGLPLAIAAVLILKNELQLRGLVIPTSREIYEPVLHELEKNGIKFEHKTSSLT